MSETEDLGQTSDLLALSEAVDEFAAAMKSKLMLKAAEGRRGWADAGDAIERPYFWQELKRHVFKGDGQEIDIANFAMMLWKGRTTNR